MKKELVEIMGYYWMRSSTYSCLCQDITFELSSFWISDSGELVIFKLKCESITIECNLTTLKLLLIVTNSTLQMEADS